MISKLIKNKGLPCNIYKILWESCVLSVAHYGAEVWGHGPKKSPECLFKRALRIYLGLGPSTPMAGCKAEEMWLQPSSHADIKIINYFCRLKQLPERDSNQQNI